MLIFASVDHSIWTNHQCLFLWRTFFGCNAHLCFHVSCHRYSPFNYICLLVISFIQYLLACYVHIRCHWYFLLTTPIYWWSLLFSMFFLLCSYQLLFDYTCLLMIHHSVCPYLFMLRYSYMLLITPVWLYLFNNDLYMFILESVDMFIIALIDRFILLYQFLMDGLFNSRCLPHLFLLITPLDQ